MVNTVYPYLSMLELYNPLYGTGSWLCKHIAPRSRPFLCGVCSKHKINRAYLVSYILISGVPRLPRDLCTMRSHTIKTMNESAYNTSPFDAHVYIGKTGNKPSTLAYT